MKSNIKKIESVLSPRDLLQISSLVPYIFLKPSYWLILFSYIAAFE